MKINLLLIFVTATFAIVLLGLSYIFTHKNEELKSYSFSSMGTSVSIIIAENNIDERVFKEAESEFLRIENIFKQAPDINNQEVKKLLNIALSIEQETEGIFSPYLGSVIDLWAFNKYEKVITKVPSKEAIKAALYEKQLNLFALAKGYAIDKAADVLRKHDINNFIVNAGGDVSVNGTKFGTPWKIGLHQTNKFLTCRAPNYAIATSSNLYNYYMIEGEKYGHLLNGNTGYPTMAEKSISVIAKNATIADAYATAVFVDEEVKDITQENISIIKNGLNTDYTFKLNNFNCVISSLNNN